MKRTQKLDARGDGNGVSFDTVREIARELDGAVERTSYGTPAFYVGKTLFARQHQDGQSLVVRIEPEQRAMRVSANPTAYSVTEHYRDSPLILVRMASIEREELRELLEEAWRLGAANGRGVQQRKRTKGKGRAT